MSLSYSQGVETQTLQAARFIANKSAEWSLTEDGISYLPNMRLSGVGYQLAATSAGDLINPLGGAWNCIKNITLFDGREVLDRLSNSSIWLAFQQARRDNHKNRSVVSVLSRGDYSYQSIGDTVVLGTGGAIHALTEDDTTPVAHLDLRECLNLLTAVPALSTKTFKNLRLLVEFQTDTNRLTTKGAVALTIQEPELIVDIQRGDMPMPKVVSWDAIEHDEYTIAAGTTPTDPAIVKSPNSNRLNAFANKTCGRLMIAKQYLDLTLQGGANNKPKNGSLANFRESINFQVNGALIMPRDLDTSASKSHIFNQAWGDVCVGPCFNEPYSNNIAVITDAQVGLTDWIGCDLGGVPLKDLSIHHNRSFIADDGSKNYKGLVAQRCHVFVECKKAIAMSGNSYIVQYV